MRLYVRLVSTPGACAGALRLMANWDLRPLARDLPRLATRLVLVTGSNDGMVPPSESYRVRSLVPHGGAGFAPRPWPSRARGTTGQVAAILLRTATHEVAG